MESGSVASADLPQGRAELLRRIGDAGRLSRGHWAFHAVTFNAGVHAYLLTSEAAVLAAEAASNVTVTRLPENDFKCPIQP